MQWNVQVQYTHLWLKLYPSDPNYPVKIGSSISNDETTLYKGPQGTQSSIALNDIFWIKIAFLAG